MLAINVDSDQMPHYVYRLPGKKGFKIYRSNEVM